MDGVHVEVQGKRPAKATNGRAGSTRPAFTGFSRLRMMPAKDTSVACID
jgi:hypothetical protein